MGFEWIKKEEKIKPSFKLKSKKDGLE